MAIVAVCFGANAQSKFGVKGGLNLASMTVKGNGVSLDTKMIAGFHLGVIMEKEFGEGLYLQPGFFFSTKGTDYHQGGFDYGFNTTYLELPVNLGYKVRLNRSKLLLAGGPYFAYGVGGKIEDRGETKDIEWGSDDKSDIKPFEAGLNLSIGLEIQKIQFTLQYGFGLNNIANAGDTDLTVKNKAFGISAAYIF